MENIKTQIKLSNISSNVLQFQSVSLYQKPENIKIEQPYVERQVNIDAIVSILKEHGSILNEIDANVSLGNKQNDDIKNETHEIKKLLIKAKEEIEKNSISSVMTILSLVFLSITLVVLISVILYGSLTLTFMHALIMTGVSFSLLAMSKLSKEI